MNKQGNQPWSPPSAAWPRFSAPADREICIKHESAIEGVKSTSQRNSVSAMLRCAVCPMQTQHTLNISTLCVALARSLTAVDDIWEDTGIMMLPGLKGL